ncbi:MAG: glycosyltransferase [Chitinophagales bacterium]
MDPRHLHIVCLDVPYPTDYGGVFDLYHKIVALHAQGILIHLHCFEYGRGEQPKLNDFAIEVNYYHRNEGHKGFSHKLPYIVCSRSNKALEESLMRDQYPILLEGIHCSYLLHSDKLKDRKIILRIHNVECVYYRQLYRASNSIFKKLYFLHESRILRQYERSIANKAILLAVTEGDADFYRQHFDARKIDFLPVFVPFTEVKSHEGAGCFCLYHGNLSVPENEQSAVWLLQHVFNELELPLVIAGKRPSTRLSRLVAQNRHACLVADPSEEELQDMIGKAQVNVIPSFNCTGIKLKLLNAIYNGRHCVVNREAVKETGLECLCHVAGNADEFRAFVGEAYQQSFDVEEIERRKDILLSKFDNRKNAEKLIAWIW